jgi:hypothetical protein
VALSLLLPSGLFSGAADHPSARVDQRVLMPAGHGIGQLAQLDGELVRIRSGFWPPAAAPHV